MSLKNSRVVVLGGSSGIGLAVAESCIADGAEVVIASSSQVRVNGAVERLGAADTAIIFMRRLLAQAAKDVQEGKDPIGSQGQGGNVRPAEMLLPDDVPWHETQLAREVEAVF